MRKLTADGSGYWLTDDQWELKTCLREFVEQRIEPRFREGTIEDTAVPFYREALRELGSMGILRLWVPEDLGGEGQNCVTLGIMTEELARGNGAIALHALENPLLGARMARSIPEAWREHGEKVLNGEWILASAMCSPEGQLNYPEQADIASFDAMRQEWVLNGVKAFCSGGTFCDCLTVGGLYEGSRYKWVVYPDTDGLTIEAHREICGSPSYASIRLENVHVPKEYGGPTGDVEDRQALGDTPAACLFHTCIAMLANGAASSSLDKTIAYLSKRTSNFKPIASLGAIQSKLVEMKGRLEACRSLAYTALHMIDVNHRDACLYSDLAKFMSCDTARAITSECVQMFGSRGVDPESGIYLQMMDAVAHGVSTGSSDLYVNAAAKAMGLPESDNIITAC